MKTLILTLEPTMSAGHLHRYLATLRNHTLQNNIRIGSVQVGASVSNPWFSPIDGLTMNRQLLRAITAALADITKRSAGDLPPAITKTFR